MTLVQLQYVLAVAENLNFTLAAKKSFVTQPTLSMQIQKLENEIDHDIFDRSTHPIKITEIGKKVVEQAKTILKEAKKMQQMVDEQRESLSGTIRLGIIPTILPSIVPLFYRTFQTKYPNAKLVITESKTDEIIQELNDGALDFGLAAIPVLEDNIKELSLYFEPLVAYVPKNHKLSNKTKLKVNDILMDEMLLLQEGHCFRENILSLCDPSQKNLRSMSVGSSNFSTLTKLADEGFGVTLLPSLYIEDMNKARIENIKYFEDPAPTREVGLIYHKSQMRIAFIKEFTNLIQGILRGVMYLEDDKNRTLPKLTFA